MQLNNATLPAMLPETERLLVLQERDRKIRTFQNELRLAPAERADLEQKIAKAGAHLDELKSQARAVEMERKKLELDAQSRRDSINKFKTQQFQTRRNEEFQALGNEIKRFEAEIQSIEDRELELMEQAEKLKGEINESEKHFAQTKQQLDQQLRNLNEKSAAIQTEIQKLAAERKQLAAEIDEDLLDEYERLMSSKGDLAIVPLEHEVCMGCHMKITTQSAVRVRAGNEIVHCEQCGRILYAG
jgi:predicted  nucleic acid-binding Zn-ribbon protein